MLTQRFLQLNLLGAEWVNWVLVSLAVVATAITLDRLLLYWRTRERFLELRAAVEETLRRGDVEAALAAVDQDTLVRNVLRSGLDAVRRGIRDPEAVEQAMLATLSAQRARYDARVPALTTIANIAPLVGLLGTIIGIVGAFYGLGQAGTAQTAGNPRVMASIAEALVTTAVGILVAVPGVVVYNLIRGYLATLLKQAETLMRELVSHLDADRAGQGPRP
jgi:biopolymer transport protein ExbB